MNEGWFLESIAADGSRPKRRIDRLPFAVGRDAGNDLMLDASGLSRRHAQIDAAGADALRVTDLGSTNGTFVNRERLAGAVAAQVRENDVIHFGRAEFRLGRDTQTTMASPPADDGRTMIVPADRRFSENFTRHEPEFMALLRGEGLSAALQPIVQADAGRRLVAYELLGRSTHPALPASPMQLFHLAALLDREAELSAAFRDYGVGALTARLAGVKLFVNTHPKETFTEEFFTALTRLRSRPGAPELVVEVHESAVMEIERMRDLAARLQALGLQFAYDDFGAGQSRINELGDVPAHYVKFDMGLVRGLHEASMSKRAVVQDLVGLVRKLGSVPLAEGVELQPEFELCCAMGFELVQGYYTGRPKPLQDVLAGG